jgi:tetratricopeptide (TPR) repeat protein
VLTDESAFATTLPLFEKCGASTTDGQMVCDMLASRALYTRKAWSDLVDFTEEWSKRSSTTFPLAVRASALNFLGRHDDAEKVTADLVAAHPDDHVALLTRAESAVLAGDLAEGLRRLRAVTQLSSAFGADFNNLAWFELYEGSDLDVSLADAQKAVQMMPKESTTLHTLASIEAERGSLVDAFEHLRESMTTAHDDHVTDAARYVEARILEQLGLTAEALAMYRVIKPSTTVTTFPTVPELAAKRIKLLTAKK